MNNSSTSQGLAACRGHTLRRQCQKEGRELEVVIHEATVHIAQKFFCYECEDTDFQAANFPAFADWSSLRIHMNTHYRYRLYRCKTCTRAFLDPSRVKRCTHAPSIKPEPQLNHNAPSINFEKSETRRKLVMDRTLLEHAQRLGVDPGVLTRDPEYPKWERRTRRYSKVCRRVQRGGRKLSGVPVATTKRGQEFPVALPYPVEPSTIPRDNSIDDPRSLFHPSVYAPPNGAAVRNPSEPDLLLSQSTFAIHSPISEMDSCGDWETSGNAVPGPLLTYPPYQSGEAHPQLSACPLLSSHPTNYTPLDLELQFLEQNALGHANSLQDYLSPSSMTLHPSPDPLLPIPNWLLELCDSDPQLGIRAHSGEAPNVGERCRACGCRGKRPAGI